MRKMKVAFLLPLATVWLGGCKSEPMANHFEGDSLQTAEYWFDGHLLVDHTGLAYRRVPGET